jgi:hypothetical protein
MSAFGNGSNSNGQFWYGSSIGFPGFLYKKNVGVGGRRSTKFAAGGNITCNSSTYLYNKYKPGVNGVGASTIANRRAKNRLASVCGGGNSKCFPCFNTLGQYNSYTGNPNGFIPCPYIPPIPPPPSYSANGTFNVSSNSEYNTIITFTGNGEITFISIASVKYLLVGGGGGGGFGGDPGSIGGGGGGGGDVLFNTLSIVNNSVYTIIIGSGGSGGISTVNGNPGNSSTITGPSNIIAIGGEGGYSINGTPLIPGKGGDSGAGGLGGVYINPTGTAGTNGGGGGGAWFAPIYPGPGAGNGGANNISTINGFNYGGGGGGGIYSGQPESIGIGAGGGGNGGAFNIPPTNALTNTGGGGGGAGNFNLPGGNGGSGICIFYFNL